MKIKIHGRNICLACVIFVPFLTFLNPSWLSINGVAPSWGVLWLLPWALEDGPISGSFSGLCLGLLLDSISLEGSSQIPVLVLLGLWWGFLGRRGPSLEKSLNLGLLASLGSLFLGFSIWFQQYFWPVSESSFSAKLWGVNVLIAHTLVTGLLAPLVCSLLLVLRRRSKIFIG